MPADGAGSHFGQYQLIARLGRGGMGETWKARRRDVRDAPTVVVKRMLPDLADDPELIEAFVNEAKLTASLSHPNIAQVLDFGQVEGEYFFVIELVHGRTLEALLGAAAAQGLPTLPAPVACAIAIGMLDALEYAHHRRDSNGRPLEIVHRDISPDNVLLSFDGEVKVVDFGVAKARWRGRSKTQTGMVKGKWSYFSPEQARGEQLDGRSDLFAVGVVLYRMLCGAMPFGGGWPEGANKLLKGEYVPPEVQQPGLDSALARVITRAMETHPEKRFQSASYMAQGLRTVLEDERGFSPHSVRAFIHWAHRRELEAERVRPQIPEVEVKRIEGWKARARELATGSRGVLPQVGATGTLTQAAVRTDHARRSPRRDWRRLALGGLFALGVLAAVVAGGPWGSSKREEALVALNRADEWVTELQSFDGARADRYRQQIAQVRSDNRKPDADEAASLRRSVELEQTIRRELLEFKAVAASWERAKALEAKAALPGARAGRPQGEEVPQGSALPVDPPDVGPPTHDVVRVPAGASRLVLSFDRHNLLTIPFPDETVFRSATPVDVDVDRTQSPVVALVRSRYGLLLGTPGASSTHRFEGVSEIRYLDFRPFASNGLKRGGSFMVRGDAGALVSQPAFRVRPSHGHFVVLEGVEGAMALTLKVADPLNVLPSVWWLAIDCRGQQGLVPSSQKIDWPAQCALGLVADEGARGTVVLELTLERSPLADVPIPTLDDEKAWDALNVSSGQAPTNAARVDEIRASLLEGRKALINGNAAGAVPLLGRCLELLPTSLDCRRLQAVAYYWSGDEARAATQFEMWAGMDGSHGDSEVTFRLAREARNRPPAPKKPPPVPELIPSPLAPQPATQTNAMRWECSRIKEVSAVYRSMLATDYVFEVTFTDARAVKVTHHDARALGRARRTLETCKRSGRTLKAVGLRETQLWATQGGPLFAGGLVAKLENVTVE